MPSSARGHYDPLCGLMVVVSLLLSCMQWALCELTRTLIMEAPRAYVNNMHRGRVYADSYMNGSYVGHVRDNMMTFATRTSVQRKGTRQASLTAIQLKSQRISCQCKQLVCCLSFPMWCYSTHSETIQKLDQGSSTMSLGPSHTYHVELS